MNIEWHSIPVGMECHSMHAIRNTPSATILPVYLKTMIDNYHKPRLFINFFFYPFDNIKSISDEYSIIIFYLYYIAKYY